MLKLCINSLRKNSSLKLQIIVFINEGTDGTPEWVAGQNGLEYLHARQNVGICYALNACRPMIRSDYIVYLNDDMYVLPGWDKALHEEIIDLGTKAFMLSATMVEPVETGNSCVIVKDYGRDVHDFDETRLLKDYKNLFVTDWSGSTWPPNVVHVDMWDLAGGLSIEFSPGMYSDPDLSRKLYEAGVRIFKGKGNSLVYHFGSKSTGKVKKNKGKKTFLQKWGITSRTFTTKYLHMGEPYTGPLTEPELRRFDVMLNKIKRLLSAL